MSLQSMLRLILQVSGCVHSMSIDCCLCVHNKHNGVQLHAEQIGCDSECFAQGCMAGHCLVWGKHLLSQRPNSSDEIGRMGTNICQHSIISVQDRWACACAVVRCSTPTKQAKDRCCFCGFHDLHRCSCIGTLCSNGDTLPCLVPARTGSSCLRTRCRSAIWHLQ